MKVPIITKNETSSISLQLKCKYTNFASQRNPCYYDKNNKIVILQQHCKFYNIRRECSITLSNQSPASVGLAELAERLFSPRGTPYGLSNLFLNEIKVEVDRT